MVRGIGGNAPPRFHWHPSFKPLAEPLNPVRLDQVTLPLQGDQRLPLQRGHLAPSHTVDRE
jgi:hypothetical protein